MDAVAIILFAIICCLKAPSVSDIETVVPIIELAVGTNPNFYEDSTAFMVIASALGFN